MAKMVSKVLVVNGEHAFNKALNVLFGQLNNAGIDVNPDDVKFGHSGDYFSALILVKEKSK